MVQRMDVSKPVFDSQTRFTMAGFHRHPTAILPPKPRSITIRRRSHVNRPVKASMGPPRQTPRPPVSQRSARAITTGKVYDNRTEQRAIAMQPKEERLQTDVQDSKAPESSGRAACHLRSYIRGAKLREIKDFHSMVPPMDQRSYLNWLQIPFNRERKIDIITRFSTGALKAGIDNFTRNYIYDNLDASATFLASIVVPPLVAASESLSLPSKSQRRIPQSFEPERSPPLPTTPKTLEEIAAWVVELPLRTVQRAMHLSHPETANWCFDEVPFSACTNRDLCQVYVWRRRPITRMETIEHSLAVIVQAPWVLSWQDLQDVVECTSVPPQTNPYARMCFSYLFKHRVWDLIRDTCQKLETQYFILTTYQGWVFGRFDTSSPGVYLNPINEIKLEVDHNPLTPIPSLVDSQDRWSRCLVSNVLDASQRLPNVVEGILYWVAASMKLEGSISTEPHSSETIKTEDISILLHSPSNSLISTPRPDPHSPTPSPRISASHPNHQKKSEIDSPVYSCRRTKNRDKHSYSPYSRSGPASGSSNSVLKSPIGPAATEGGRFRPTSLFVKVKHFMRWLTVQGRSA